MLSCYAEYPKRFAEGVRFDAYACVYGIQDPALSLRCGVRSVFLSLRQMIPRFAANLDKLY